MVAMETSQDPIMKLEPLKNFKMSYFYKAEDSPMTSLTVGQLVDQAADQWGSKEYLCDLYNNQRLTFGQLKTETDKFASGLLEIGLKPGDRLGIWGPNSIWWMVTYFAAAKAGLIVVPLNTQYERADLEHALNHVAVKCIVIAGEFGGRNYLNMLKHVVPELSSSTGDFGQTIRSSVVPSLTMVITMENQRPSNGLWLWNEVYEKGRNQGALENLKNCSEAIQFDDIVHIIFTSGTTGRPKGVTISHHSIINSMITLSKVFDYTDEKRHCSTAPFFSTFGINICGVCPIVSGCSVVIPSPQFNPSVCIKAAADERCTEIQGTPTMFIAMMNTPGFDQLDLSSLSSVTCGGASGAPSLFTDMLRNYGVSRIQTCYGMTEILLATATREQDDSDVALNTVGYPVNNVEIKIVDKQGRIVPVGASGEICIRGISVTQGYWNDPEKNREVIDSARWFHTGDAGFFYPSGHLSIHGRFKEMMIRGGEHIYPKEIEDYLQSRPEIVEAQVFGIPDEKLGQVVAAWILPKSGISLDAKAVQSMCEGQISRSKIPAFVKILQTREEFPQTPSGKISKVLMLQRYSKELALTTDDSLSSCTEMGSTAKELPNSSQGFVGSQISFLMKWVQNVLVGKTAKILT